MKEKTRRGESKGPLQGNTDCTITVFSETNKKPRKSFGKMKWGEKNKTPGKTGSRQKIGGEKMVVEVKKDKTQGPAKQIVRTRDEQDGGEKKALYAEQDHR